MTKAQRSQWRQRGFLRMMSLTLPDGILLQSAQRESTEWVAVVTRSMRLTTVLYSLLLASLLAAPAFASAPRHDRWEVIGSAGGGMFSPAISPHDTKLILVIFDMTGAYISQDAGRS